MTAIGIAATGFLRGSLFARAVRTGYVGYITITAASGPESSPSNFFAIVTVVVFARQTQGRGESRGTRVVVGGRWWWWWCCWCTESSHKLSLARQGWRPRAIAG